MYFKQVTCTRALSKCNVDLSSSHSQRRELLGDYDRYHNLHMYTHTYNTNAVQYSTLTTSYVRRRDQIGRAENDRLVSSLNTLLLKDGS